MRIRALIVVAAFATTCAAQNVTVLLEVRRSPL